VIILSFWGFFWCIMKLVFGGLKGIR